MIKIFRKHTKIIVWFIVASFVIWGGYSVSALKEDSRYAGVVFGKPVSFQEYNKFYRATALFMPTKDKNELQNPEVYRTFTWQNIIYAREAKRLGIKVTDAEVREQLSNILTQQGLGALTPDQYAVWLTRTLQLTPREFEEGLREFMRIQKLIRDQLVKFAPKNPAPAEDKNAVEEQKQKQQADFMIWTNTLNQRARLKDYLEALPAAPGLVDTKPAEKPAASDTSKTPSASTAEATAAPDTASQSADAAVASPEKPVS